MSKEVNFSVMCHATYQSKMTVPDEYCESRESILEYIRENLADAPVLEIEYLSDIDADAAVTDEDIYSIQDSEE